MELNLKINKKKKTAIRWQYGHRQSSWKKKKIFNWKAAFSSIFYMKLIIAESIYF